MSFRTQFAHFDSCQAKYITDVNNTTGVSANPYKASFPMNQTFSKIKRVYLKSVELPQGFSNVRKGATDNLKFTLNGTTYSVTLNEKYYSSITTLITDLNTACVGVVGGVTITFSLSQLLTTPNRLLITFSGTTVTTFTIIDTNLSKYVLGFRAGIDTLAGQVYSASYSNFNLSFDNYILLYIPSLNGMNACMGQQISTFKIPLNSNTNTVYYYFEGSSFSQFVDITDRNLNLSSLTVFVYDRFGYNLTPMGLDYSFSLAIELWD